MFEGSGDYRGESLGGRFRNTACHKPISREHHTQPKLSQQRREQQLGVCVCVCACAHMCFCPSQGHLKPHMCRNTRGLL